MSFQPKSIGDELISPFILYITKDPYQLGDLVSNFVKIDVLPT